MKAHPWLRLIKKISVGEREIELLQSILTKTKIAKKKERVASLEKD